MSNAVAVLVACLMAVAWLSAVMFGALDINPSAPIQRAIARRRDPRHRIKRLAMVFDDAPAEDCDEIGGPRGWAEIQIRQSHPRLADLLVSGRYVLNNPGQGHRLRVTCRECDTTFIVGEHDIPAGGKHASCILAPNISSVLDNLVDCTDPSHRRANLEELATSRPMITHMLKAGDASSLVRDEDGETFHVVCPQCAIRTRLEPPYDDLLPNHRGGCPLFGQPGLSYGVTANGQAPYPVPAAASERSDDDDDERGEQPQPESAERVELTETLATWAAYASECELVALCTSVERYDITIYQHTTWPSESSTERVGALAGRDDMNGALARAMRSPMAIRHHLLVAHLMDRARYADLTTLREMVGRTL